MDTSMERLRCKVSSIEFHYGGTLLNSADTALIRSTLLMRAGLFSDLAGTPEHAYIRILCRYKSIDVLDMFKSIKALKSAYIAALNGRETISGFKLPKGWRGKDPITEASAFFSRRPEAMIQWLSFDERLNLRSIDYKSLMLDDYVNQEKELSELELDSSIIEALNAKIVEKFKDFSLWERNPLPHHGPGCVADAPGRLSILEKFRHGQATKAWIRQVLENLGIDDADWVIPVDPIDTELRICELVVVPKNILKGRTISKEPIYLQYFQQALRERLYEYVDRSPYINTTFSWQGRSRGLAWIGSFNGLWATIDFSSASDYITVELVDKVFQGTQFHDLLLLLRSTHVKLGDGRIIELKKYAPMGSALCFPVMDIILESLCDLACNAAPNRPYVVYGDDVVIDSKFALEFIKLAEAIGLKVNYEKTFITPGEGVYREACGIEAYAGQDITPVRIGRRFNAPLRCGDYRNVDLPENWVGWSDLSNTLYYANYKETRKILNSFLVDVSNKYHKFARVVPFEEGPAPYFVTDYSSCTNYGARVCYSKEYQRRYINVLTVAASHVRESRSTSDALATWLNRADMLDQESRHCTGHPRRIDEKISIDRPGRLVFRKGKIWL